MIPMDLNTALSLGIIEKKNWTKKYRQSKKANEKENEDWLSFHSALELCHVIQITVFPPLKPIHRSEQKDIFIHR